MHGAVRRLGDEFEWRIVAGRDHLQSLWERLRVLRDRQRVVVPGDQVEADPGVDFNDRCLPAQGVERVVSGQGLAGRAIPTD